MQLNYWGDISPYPRILAPLNENTLRTRRRGSIFCESLLWTGPYEITIYTAKNVLRTRISLQNDSIQRTGWSLLFRADKRAKNIAQYC